MTRVYWVGGYIDNPDNHPSPEDITERLLAEQETSVRQRLDRFVEKKWSLRDSVWLAKAILREIVWLRYLYPRHAVLYIKVLRRGDEYYIGHGVEAIERGYSLFPTEPWGVMVLGGLEPPSHEDYLEAGLTWCGDCCPDGCWVDDAGNTYGDDGALRYYLEEYLQPLIAKELEAMENITPITASAPDSVEATTLLAYLIDGSGIGIRDSNMWRETCIAFGETDVS